MGALQRFGNITIKKYIYWIKCTEALSRIQGSVQNQICTLFEFSAIHLSFLIEVEYLFGWFPSIFVSFLSFNFSRRKWISSYKSRL